MKQALLLLLAITLLQQPGRAQETKKAKTEKQESREEAKERHKKFWKKVGTDQRDFWKNEHEKHAAKQDARKAKKSKEKAEKEEKVKEK